MTKLKLRYFSRLVVGSRFHRLRLISVLLLAVLGSVLLQCGGVDAQSSFVPYASVDVVMDFDALVDVDNLLCVARILSIDMQITGG